MEERWCEIEKTLLEVFPELLNSNQWYLIFLHVTCDLCDLHPGKTWPISSGSTAAWSTANSRQKFLWLDLFIYIYIYHIYYVLFWRSCITYKFTVLPWHHIINMINVPKEQNIDVFEGLAVPPGSIPCLQFGTSGEASTNSKGCPAGVPMAILTIPPFRSCAIYFHYCVQKEIVNSWQWYA